MGPMPPPHGGVSINMLAIHEALKENGHESRIIDITNRRGEAESAEVLKPRSAAGLIKLLAGLECDIVHYHIGGDFGLRLAMLTLFCGWLPRKISVVTFHSGGYAREHARRARPRSIRGAAFRSAEILIGVNEQMIEMFKSFGADEKRVRLIGPFELRRPDPSVSLPGDLEAFASGFDPFLVSVGALEREYNHGFLIDSMPEVLKRFPDAGLMIIGSGSLEPELRGSLASLRLEKRVLLAGNLGHPVVLHLIDRADAVLRITDYDGDSITIREAQFLGTPVIASDNVSRPKGVFLVRSPFGSGDLVEALTTAKEAQISGQILPVDGGRNAVKVLEAYEELLGG